LCRGHSLDELVAATYVQKVMYSHAKAQYEKAETDKWRQLLGVAND
jgi:hypothetical protein